MSWATATAKEPHCHASYPWLEDPASLLNNRKTVEATFLRTERPLAKEPLWKAAYAAQVQDMVSRESLLGWVKTLISWDVSLWYVSHLIASNLCSITVPVRLVWNSSQKFRGVSLNYLLLKGSHVLNPICAVLSVDSEVEFTLPWVTYERFTTRSGWKNGKYIDTDSSGETEEEELEEYAITRANIAEKPAGCIAQLAMRESANLPSFAYLKKEQQLLQCDRFVRFNNIDKNLDQLKTITANVGRILRAGGFQLKPWGFSEQSGRKECSDKLERTKTETLVLPNQMQDDENKRRLSWTT